MVVFFYEPGVLPEIRMQAYPTMSTGSPYRIESSDSRLLSQLQFHRNVDYFRACQDSRDPLVRLGHRARR